MSFEEIRASRPVTNTLHNLIQTLSVKLDSAARYNLYQQDAREDRCAECEEIFRQLGGSELEAIRILLAHLRVHLFHEPGT